MGDQTQQPGPQQPAPAGKRGSVTAWAALLEVVALLLTAFVIIAAAALGPGGDTDLSWSPLIHLIIGVIGFLLSMIVTGVTELFLRRSPVAASGWSAMAVVFLIAALAAQLVLRVLGPGAQLAVTAIAVGSAAALLIAAPRQGSARTVYIVYAVVAGLLVVWTTIELIAFVGPYAR